MEKKITELEKELISLDETLDKTGQVHVILENQKSALEKEVEILDMEVEKLKEEVKSVEYRRGKLESEIDANLLVSPAVYRISVTIFIILILAVVVTRGKNLIAIGPKNKKE